MFYELYNKRDHLYNMLPDPILTSKLEKNDQEQNAPIQLNMKEISQEFYEGFDHDLM